MKRLLLIVFISQFHLLAANGQTDEAYLKANAIRIPDSEKVPASVYDLLSRFQILMLGEMHGTNESAQIVKGLAELYTRKGDSVQVGLEIPADLMEEFLRLRTDSSIFHSTFFYNPPYLDGRESLPWANLLVALNKNPKVQIFFFDTNRDKETIPIRDSAMAMKIKGQYLNHPKWKMITLSGNYHNRISEYNTMASVLKRNVSANLGSLNIEYKEGSCHANFSKGLEIKRLGSYPSVYNSIEGYDQYIFLYPEKTIMPYDGIYFTRYITAAKMVSINK